MSNIEQQIQDALARAMQWGVSPDEIFLGPEERQQLTDASNANLNTAGIPSHSTICDGQSKYRGMTIRFLLNPGCRVGASFHGDKK